MNEINAGKCPSTLVNLASVMYELMQFAYNSRKFPFTRCILSVSFYKLRVAANKKADATKIIQIKMAEGEIQQGRPRPPL